jgi:hypothetical protein
MILPGTGRGTSRRLVEGAGLHQQAMRNSLLGKSPTPRPSGAVPLPFQGRI